MKKFLLGIAFALVACSSFAQPTLKLEPSKLDMKAGDVQEITVSVVGAEAWAYCAAQFVITLPEGVELGGKYMNGYTEEKVADEYAKYLKKNKKTDSEETYKEFLKEKESTYFIETLFPSQRLFKSIDVAYNYIDQEKVDVPNIQSRTTLEYLKHKAVAGIHFNLPLNMELGVNFRYQDRTGSFTDTDSQVRDYEPYSVADVRLQWRNGRYELFLEGNNLTGKQYFDYGCVPQPGFWTIAGISVDF